MHTPAANPVVARLVEVTIRYRRGSVHVKRPGRCRPVTMFQRRLESVPRIALLRDAALRPRGELVIVATGVNIRSYEVGDRERRGAATSGHRR